MNGCGPVRSVWKDIKRIAAILTFVAASVFCLLAWLGVFVG